LSIATLSGLVSYNYLSGGELTPALKNHEGFKMVNTFVGLTVFVTGIANVFLVKGGKKLTDPVHKMWIHFFELKFILALLLTPLIYPITSIFAEEGQNVISSETKDKIQFYIVVFMFFYSSFTRYFREEVCHGFKKDFIMEKVN